MPESIGSDLFCGRSLIEETGLFVGLVCLHLHHNVVVHLSTGPARRAGGKVKERCKKSELFALP